MSGVLPRLVCTAAVAAGAVLAPAPATAVPEPGGPGDRSVAGLLTALQALYQGAEKATETYNATEERLEKQRTETERGGTYRPSSPRGRRKDPTRGTRGPPRPRRIPSGNPPGPPLRRSGLPTGRPVVEAGRGAASARATAHRVGARSPPGGYAPVAPEASIR